MQFFHKSAPAPAKVNFFLNITGVRPDGYHLLHTLMHKIELFDEVILSIKKRTHVDVGKHAQVALSLSGYPIPDQGLNTAQKAVELFWAHIGRKDDCANIHIKKNIPDQAGLGGGSSDAATTLLLMNEAYDNMVSQSELIFLAKQIGADVPFFLGSSASICTGIGEKTEPVYAYSDVPMLIIKPRQGVSTAQAYARIDMRNTLSNTEKSIHETSSMISSDDAIDGVNRIKQTQHLWSNDFQEFALEDVPILAEIQEFMKKNGAFYSALSGSGSAWFGCFDQKNECLHAYDLAREIFVSRGCFVCKTQTLTN